MQNACAVIKGVEIIVMKWLNVYNISCYVMTEGLKFSY